MILPENIFISFAVLILPVNQYSSDTKIMQREKLAAKLYWLSGQFPSQAFLLNDFFPVSL